MKPKRLAALALTAAILAPAGVIADNYLIDTEGAHAFIQFRIKHLGYSWLSGRFNDFSGNFSYDENKPEASTVQVTINMASIDSNHAERDKHLRGEDFLDVDKYPEAKFVSTAFQEKGDGTATLEGKLTLRGQTRPITIEVEHIGHGPDPWGGYRRGFEGTARLTLADYGIDYDLGPASRELDLILSVEGIRQ
jgi:polyisoprenoid-binding protein YceI